MKTAAEWEQEYNGLEPVKFRDLVKAIQADARTGMVPEGVSGTREKKKVQTPKGRR